MGKLSTNPEIGLFWPSGWVTARKVGLNILTQLLVENNPIAGFAHI